VEDSHHNKNLWALRLRGATAKRKFQGVLTGFELTASLRIRYINQAAGCVYMRLLPVPLNRFRAISVGIRDCAAFDFGQGQRNFAFVGFRLKPNLQFNFLVVDTQNRSRVSSEPFRKINQIPFFEQS
jgi:hypothetical protein